MAGLTAPHESEKRPPRRRDGLPILNDFLNYRADPLNFWLTSSQLGSVVRVHLGPFLEYWVITDPDFLQHILQTRVKYYPRERRLTQLNRLKGPELLFNTNKWEEWLWRRRLMQPAFHRQAIQNFATIMVEETQKLMESWQVGLELELEKAMKTLTMRIIGRTMFSTEVGEETDQLQESYELSSAFVFARAAAIIPGPLWLPTAGNRRLKRALQWRTQHLKKIVHDRYQHAEDPKGDLLDLLISATLAEDGRQFTAEQLVGEMSGIVFAGHETTAMTQMWLFYLLSQHPEVEAKILAEIETVLGDRPPTFEDLPQMPYTEWVILETLRLYPPVYVTLREAGKTDQFGDYLIPQGTRMVINIRGLHRDPQHWPEPERFDPTRFGPEQVNARHKFAFLPFIQGPRKCMGDTFAMMEMRLITAAILQRYRLRYTAPHAPVEEPSFVLHVKGGLRMRLE